MYDTLNNISDKVNKILLENGKLEEFKVEESYIFFRKNEHSS